MQPLSNRTVSICMLACLVLSACGENTGLETLGYPTLIPEGKTSIDVLCGIQEEFRSLPKPLLRSIEFIEESNRAMSADFMRVKEKLPAYYQFELNAQAQAWTGKHTSAELSASLAPLVMDEVLGGEVAVFLTALATNRKFRTDQYGYHKEGIATEISHFMFASGYRSPIDTGNWDRSMAAQLQLPSQIALVFTRSATGDETTEFERLIASERTLNFQLRTLRNLLFYYENGMGSPSYPDGTFQTAATLEDWLVANKLPAPMDVKRHQALLAQFENQFIVFAAAAAHVPRGIAVHLLGQGKYWPLLYNQRQSVEELSGYGSPRESELRQQYLFDLKQRILEVTNAACGGLV